MCYVMILWGGVESLDEEVVKKLLNWNKLSMSNI